MWFRRAQIYVFFCTTHNGFAAVLVEAVSILKNAMSVVAQGVSANANFIGRKFGVENPEITVAKITA
jgi:hypothetical protein